MSPPKGLPALTGGVFIGVLSGLPIVQAGNCCCCLWIISGGLIAAWVMQQNYPRPITAGDGAVAGLLAGIVGAFVWLVVTIPVQSFTAPMQGRWVERLIERAPDMPENVRAALEAMRDREMSAVGIVLGFVMWFVLGMIFGTIGGMLGSLFFKKDQPPAGAVDILPPE